MYLFFNLAVDSNIPLPELPEIEAGEASISFQLQSSPPKFQTYNTIHHWRLPDGEITITCARSGEDYILRFPDLADFLIVNDSADIRCYPCPGIDEVSIRHLLLDQVIPRIIGHSGSIVLHASAVAINGVAAAFLGETGCGKSTLAASFLINGYPILTDDCLLIRPEAKTIIGIYSYVGVRLWEDSIDAIVGKQYELNKMAHYSSKMRLILHADSTNEHDEIPIAAIFLLAPPVSTVKTGTIDIKKIDGAQIATELIKHSFILDVSDKEKIAEKFNNTGKIAASGFPMYQLNYPRNHALLDQVRTAVEEMVTAKSLQ